MTPGDSPKPNPGFHRDGRSALGQTRTSRDVSIGSSYGIIVIPARLQSSRLPQKLLLNDSGRPLLAYTIEQAQLAVAASQGLLREVVVACDDDQLIEVAEVFGVRGVITSDSHPNGTCRIAEAIQKISISESHSFVLNVQGDQPEFQPEAVLQVVTDLIEHPECDMATAAVEYSASDTALLVNPNVVKVEFDSSGYAIDFRRHSTTKNNCPFTTVPDSSYQDGDIFAYPAARSVSDREPCNRWYRHVGIYAYRTSFLQRYAAAPPSVREQQESLEQLRALEMGAAIRVSLITAEQAGRAIDTPADYADFADRMRHRKAASR